MTIVVEAMWFRLHVLLAAFAERVTTVDPTLIHSIGSSSNDAFLLRAYVAFRRYSDGEEVAITVDVQTDADQLIIVSDVSTDNGQVIMVGPSTIIPSLGNQPGITGELDEWLDEFEDFLREVEPTVAMTTSKLL